MKLGKPQLSSCQEGRPQSFTNLLDGTLVDSTALVDHVPGGGRLSRVDVSAD